jgi:DNA modification methylase
VKIEDRPVEAITPYQNNPRRNSQAVECVAKSIKEFGFRQPIVVDEQGVIIVGHTRWKAAKKLGMTTVPVHVAEGLTPAQIKAYRIADNKTNELAEWDLDILPVELKELQALDVRLEDLGFDPHELERIMGNDYAGHTDPDAVPEVQADVISQTGDLWEMGAHRLLCGDSTKAEDVARVMNGEKAGLMNTDPPYGVDYGGIRDSIRASGRGGIKYDDIENDELNGAALQEFLEKCIRTAVPHLVENPAFYLWHPMLTQGTFFAAAAAAAADILIHRQIIWVKPSLIMGRGDYHWRHELCFYGWIRGKRCPWMMGRDQDTVWEVGREQDGIHPTQKPIELFMRPIKNHLNQGEICYEPFSGSGSQLIAAEQLGRKCYALEICERYVDVAVRRWQQHTGKQAVNLTRPEIVIG